MKWVALHADWPRLRTLHQHLTSVKVVHLKDGRVCLGTLLHYLNHSGSFSTMFARQALRPVTLLTTVRGPNCRCQTSANKPQSVRQYSSSTESGARWWHSTPVRYGLYGVGSLGVASLLVDNWRLRRHANAMEQIANEALVYSGERDPSPKVFTGGEQGFVPLTLESVADVNHNTKRFKFKFEDAKAVSGLSYCCKYSLGELGTLTCGSGASGQAPRTRVDEAGDAAVHSNQS